MAETYKPGDTVPRDGTVECTQYPGTRDKVKAGRHSHLAITGRTTIQGLHLAVRRLRHQGATVLRGLSGLVQ